MSRTESADRAPADDEMPLRVNWEIAKRIGCCLAGDMEMTRSRLADTCNMGHNRCGIYLRHLQMLGLVTIGKHVCLTGRGRKILYGNDKNPVWNSGPSLEIPPNIAVKATGPLTRVDIGKAIAEDEHGSTPMVTNDAPDAFPVGITPVTWLAMGDSGKITMAIQTVTVTNFADR